MKINELHKMYYQKKKNPLFLDFHILSPFSSRFMSQNVYYLLSFTVMFWLVSYSSDINPASVYSQLGWLLDQDARG